METGMGRWDCGPNRSTSKIDMFFMSVCTVDMYGWLITVRLPGRPVETGGRGVDPLG